MLGKAGDWTVAFLYTRVRFRAARWCSMELAPADSPITVMLLIQKIEIKDLTPPR